MAIIVKEHSRRTGTAGKRVSRTRQYTLWGADNAHDIEAALLFGTNAYTDGAATIAFGGIPATIDGVSFQSSEVEALDDSQTVWAATANWGEDGSSSAPPRQQLNEVRTSSRAGIRMVKAKTSLETVGQYVANNFNGGNPEDFGQLVNVQEDGSVEGADIPEPFIVYSVKKIVALASVTDSYQVQAQSIVGKLNSIEYHGRAAQTLRCESIAFNQSSDDECEINAEFAFAPHRYNLTVGSVTGINKNAWDYLWPYKIKRKGDKTMRAETVQVNVERMHELADFYAALGF